MLFGQQVGIGQLFTLICASLCFGSFFWGALFLFKRPKPRPPLMVVVSACIALTILSQIAAILGYYLHDPIRLVTASVLYVISFVLFWCAVVAVRGNDMSYAFAPGPPRGFVQNGPFAWIRHPFYTSYLTAWLAGWVATGQWWLLAPAAVTGWLLLRAAQTEEAAFLASPFAVEYRLYQRSTGRFLPRLWRSS